MASLFHAIAGLSLASIALLSPLTPLVHARHHHARHHHATSPCAQVGAAIAGKDLTTEEVTVPAELAWNCINSVPFNQSAALALVNGVVPYFKWQSNTAWLKDPPAEYVEKIQSPVDIWAGLAEIKEKVTSGEYKNEYEFGFELYTLTQSTHDFHFMYIPDVVGTVFGFARPVPLVSVSSDGKELPRPFVYADILAESFGNATFTPSPITHIDGQDATDFLENWGQYGQLQDRDALYNSVFYELAAVSLGSGRGSFAGSDYGRFNYPGPTTELTFENGTSRTYENLARVRVPFDGITDGESLYKLWFTGPGQIQQLIASNSTSPTPTPSPASSPTPVSPIPAPGYPPPIFREAHNAIGGYFLEGDYSDVAVLSVPSFLKRDEEVPFQDIAVKFLAAAKSAGKKKLVIDVSANGGGTILAGYDLYKLVFPQKIDHAAADRYRAFEVTRILNQKYSEASEGVPRVLNSPNRTLAGLVGYCVSRTFNYRSELDVNNKPFESWQDKFGPGLEQKGDNFTNLIRWNFNDTLVPIYYGAWMHGYGPLSNYTQAPFAAEDVVVVADGYCSSTCAVFSELMRQRAGVKYISLGGRPRKGITQAVGGVKGSSNYPWSWIQSYAQYAINNLSTPEEGAQLNTTELGEYFDNTVFARSSDTPMNVNSHDSIRDGDETNTPLQFIYEPSDCRILYTKAMTVDVTAIWKAVVDSTWGGVNHCIAGDLGGNSTSRIAKRGLSVSERKHTKSMQSWRKSLKAADYPLDVRADLGGVKSKRDSSIWPWLWDG